MSETDETFEEYADAYLRRAIYAVGNLNIESISSVAELISYTKFKAGRLFILGVGGSAANASHAVNDFRKLCEIEAYCPTDNVSELTARINDDKTGWEYAFVHWLKTNHLSRCDTVMILSVSGGNADSRVSRNLVHAINYAIDVKAGIVGIVGDVDGHTAKHADACVVIPSVGKRFKTPINESLQAIVWHMIANDPGLKKE